jgi:thioredoxin reductase
MLEIAIIGAGPYGLSLGAHFRRQGIPFRIFGRPMDSWLAHMPKGMMLKSDGFASNIYDPNAEFTLSKFCTERGIKYADIGVPVKLDTFTAYGLAFRERMVPELEDRMVVSIDRAGDGFVLKFEDGEKLSVRRVVLAVGITHFEHVPANLAHLPAEFLSHSACHRDLEPFRGRRVVVIGGGSSALDMAGLLKDGGTDVELVARQTSLKYHSAPLSTSRSLWKRIRHPQSGLGPGMRSRFYSDAPLAFHYLPENIRLDIVRTSLGPSGGWFIREKVEGRVPQHLGFSPEKAEVQNGKMRLHIRSADGTEREISADHIIAATGYKVDMERLKFLSGELRSKIKTVNSTPLLSSTFESSVPGLYFVGVAAANSFGPVMRFAFGAGFAARRVTQAVAKSGVRSHATVPVSKAMSAAK